MKKRIKIDSALLSFFIILTGLLYQFPQFYGQSVFVDDVFDRIGLFCLLTGIFFRMVSRGYKKINSQEGHELVVKGPYKISRNPMYLGSFLMGSGFVLIVWPWWSLVVFAYLFYYRFRPQIEKEERFLEKTFGGVYEEYARKVPRIFPDIRKLKKMRFDKIFPRDTLWTTKEKYGFWGWPILAVLLESFQEEIIFGFTDLSYTLSVFLVVMVVFAASIWVMYKYA